MLLRALLLSLAAACLLCSCCVHYACFPRALFTRNRPMNLKHAIFVNSSSMGGHNDSMWSAELPPAPPQQGESKGQHGRAESMTTDAAPPDAPSDKKHKQQRSVRIAEENEDDIEAEEKGGDGSAGRSERKSDAKARKAAKQAAAEAEDKRDIGWSEGKRHLRAETAQNEMFNSVRGALSKLETSAVSSSPCLLVPPARFPVVTRRCVLMCAFLHTRTGAGERARDQLRQDGAQAGLSV